MHNAPDWDAAVRAIIAQHHTRPGPLLPVLHAVQDLLGYIPAAAVAVIAEGINLSRAEVHGVISYYHHFRQQAPARHVLQICRAEACQARGAEALAAHAERTLGCAFHASSSDGSTSLEPVYCLGHCAVGPNIAIGDTCHARVTPARFDALLAQLTEAA